MAADTAIAQELVQKAADGLCIRFRSLCRAVCALEWQENSDTEVCGTDGRIYAYSPLRFVQLFRRGGGEAMAFLLHSVLHCLFRHVFRCGGKDRALWNLAADIAVEKVIAETGLLPPNPEKQRVFASLSEKTGTLTCDSLYLFWLDSPPEPEDAAYWEGLFYADSHDRWYPEPPPLREDPYSQEGETPSIYKRADDRPGNGEPDEDRSQGMAGNDGSGERDEEWERIARRVQLETDTNPALFGSVPGSAVQQLRAVNREKGDCARLLRRFASPGEVMHPDDTAFDLIYYMYGLQLYGNLPLIEPLETTESDKIRDFVIAIDTSGSVQGERVQRFMEKAYTILKTENRFFEQVNIHMVQCDTEIREDTVISSLDQLEKHIASMQLHGFGGTDFRPVFSYVDALLAEGVFDNLKGLLYFTDGVGRYPETPPAYQTAFVFLDDGYSDPQVPLWAMKLIV